MFLWKAWGFVSMVIFNLFKAIFSLQICTNFKREEFVCNYVSSSLWEGHVSLTWVHCKYFHIQKYNLSLCPNFRYTSTALHFLWSGIQWTCQKWSGSSFTELPCTLTVVYLYLQCKYTFFAECIMCPRTRDSHPTFSYKKVSVISWYLHSSCTYFFA